LRPAVFPDAQRARSRLRSIAHFGVVAVFLGHARNASSDALVPRTQPVDSDQADQSCHAPLHDGRARGQARRNPRTFDLGDAAMARVFSGFGTDHGQMGAPAKRLRDLWATAVMASSRVDRHGGQARDSRMSLAL